MRSFSLSGVMLLIGVSTFVAHTREAVADGLIDRLPPDGAWAQYAVVVSVEPELQIPKGLEVVIEPELTRRSESWGSLRLSSVGRAEEGGRPCRWVEIHTQNPSPATHQSIMFKMLIPEEHIAKGTDPFAHVIKLYVKYDRLNEGKPSLIEDDKQKRYELDRLRLWVIPPVGQSGMLDATTIATNAGSFTCEGEGGKIEYEATGLIAGSSYSYVGRSECFRHEKSPFGVVSMSLIGMGREELAEVEVNVINRSLMKAVLMEYGESAESQLPECN